MTPSNEKKLKKAKGVFLKHLKEVDTSQGPVNEVILKFHLVPEVEIAFGAFVRHYGCTMTTRILTRAEQNAIDPRRKSCDQHTSVLVTPEAQAAFLNKSLVAPKFGREIMPAPISHKTQLDSANYVTKATPNETASPNKLLDEQIVRIPGITYEVLTARLSDVVRLLPTEDPLQGMRCRSELVDIAHELRHFRPATKRPLDDKGRGVNCTHSEEPKLCSNLKMTLIISVQSLSKSQLIFISKVSFMYSVSRNLT
ncbi:hypothetical protein MVEN_02506800 [Mycena venus]|uniref:Uncharacterized protein n=1 Tax=Mycena venus TaxID=2733690 RepID=A0A8H6U4J6_9AGAR|nr:hypothetical protein MVEN_02506800 [Mycena venus]